MCVLGKLLKWNFDTALNLKLYSIRELKGRISFLRTCGDGQALFYDTIHRIL